VTRRRLPEARFAPWKADTIPTLHTCQQVSLMYWIVFQSVKYLPRACTQTPSFSRSLCFPQRTLRAPPKLAQVTFPPLNFLAHPNARFFVHICKDVSRRKKIGGAIVPFVASQPRGEIVTGQEAKSKASSNLILAP
jgi:hypothetical protein